MDFPRCGAGFAFRLLKRNLFGEKEIQNSMVFIAQRIYPEPKAIFQMVCQLLQNVMNGVPPGHGQLEAAVEPDAQAYAPAPIVKVIQLALPQSRLGRGGGQEHGRDEILRMPSAFLRLLSPKGQIKQRDDILQKLVLPALKRLFYLGDDQKIQGVLRPR